MQSAPKFAVLVLVLSFLTAPAVLAQAARRQSAAVDPYGKPLPSREQQRARLEQLLGRSVHDGAPIQRGPVGTSGDPYEGADNPVAYTSADPLALAQSTPDDLAETPDVKFTPEVQATVSRLGGDPAKLYLYVKNGYVFTPYVGSQKGSQGTELEFAGNDFDQASFLIALLRYSGVPARYVFGSMYIDTEKALNWLQVDSPTAAMNVLQWQGISARFVKAGGGSLLIDRVWVEALIDRHGPKPRWIPMDPAFKQYQITPASPLATAVGFDENAYLHLSPTDRRTPYDFLAGNLQNYLNTSAPGTTVDDVVRKSSIIPATFPKGLPGRLENRTRHRSETSMLTDTQRYLVGVLTVDAQGVSAQTRFRLPEIYGQRLTVSFPPATSADQALVQSSGGYYKAPADQLHVVASINLNGQAVATGSRAVSIGDGHYVVIDLLFPGATLPATLFHTVFAGGYYALGLDVQGDQGLELSERTFGAGHSAPGVQDPGYNDATTGEFMHTQALVYLNHVQTQRLKIGALFSADQVMDVSEALTMQNIVIEYTATGLHFRPNGWTVDAQRVVGELFPDAGANGNGILLADMDGLGSSRMEAQLWEDAVAIPSISTTTGLQIANTLGIPVYRIDQTNAASVLPTLNVFPEVLQNLQTEINAGFSVTIPRDTLIMNQWVGSVWIEKTPEGFPVGYFIQGGLFGGSTTVDPLRKPGKNPNCADLNSAFDNRAGNYPSDFLRAIAYDESGMQQFSQPKHAYCPSCPTINVNSNGTIDVGLMQVNTTSKTTAGELSQLAQDWQYNLQQGTNVFNFGIGVATKYFNFLGVVPTQEQLLTEAYFTYNHGHAGTDHYYALVDGQLVKATDTNYDNYANRSAGQLKGIRAAQDHADSVAADFRNQSWSKVCP